ncbi:hypothetical protein [Burkholderia stagnalis]|uniref:hypothetical protein n=1 Tax=Burkholderia stagnalis TaxID=1503054 RepID=UPI001E4F5071|nr:hypothetical protein [Burkholderia stagnalis]
MGRARNNVPRRFAGQARGRQPVEMPHLFEVSRSGKELIPASHAPARFARAGQRYDASRRRPGGAAMCIVQLMRINRRPSRLPTLKRWKTSPRCTHVHRSEAIMHAGHHFLHELRHATMPTYFVSYVFPLLLVVYETYRIAYWVGRHGWNFAQLSQAGYEFTLMLIVFALQVMLDGVLFMAAWVSRHPDVEHRHANMMFGIVCSALVIAFDVALRAAF